nr:MAG TPA: hypothetical protein [Caudoviricetes sp.]
MTQGYCYSPDNLRLQSIQRSLTHHRPVELTAISRRWRQ